jgi:lipopolysaccharide export system permease protein
MRAEKSLVRLRCVQYNSPIAAPVDHRLGEGMRLLDRMVLKEIATVFALGVLVLTFVMLTGKILRLVELIVSKGVGILTVLQLFFYGLPYSLVITIPMSVLLATLVTFTRLAGDAELLGFHGAGVSLLRLSRPAVFFGLLTTAVTLIITIWILPASNQALKGLVFQISQRQATVGLQEGVFTQLEGFTLYVERIDRKTQSMEGVFLVDNRIPKQQRIVIAQTGQFQSDPATLQITLLLHRGTIQVLSGEEVSGQYRYLSFMDQTLTIDFRRNLADPIQRTLGDQELSLTELLQRSAELKAQGKNYHPPLVEFHKKLAIPVCCLLFTLVGVPLGSRFRKGGRGISLAISVACALGYYMLIVAGEALGDRGLVSEAVVMWFPNALIAVVGTLLLLRSTVYPASILYLFTRRIAPVRAGLQG